MATKVKFLIEKPEFELQKTVFAFFPEMNYHNIGHCDYDNHFMSYSHLGQHCPCHIDYAKKCKEATKDEYLPLLNELKGLGYDDLLTLNKEKP